ncbi:hypothetical protein [Bacillus piscicola]|uniref:hypothetical protein n=1 Tax=Bacillus piscicola TaxID=1632684 RepID=UPI001F090FB4|nr:hypothetical protein [Bacillus piscicola]
MEKIVVNVEQAEHALEVVKNIAERHTCFNQVHITFLYVFPVSTHSQESKRYGKLTEEMLYSYADFYQKAEDYLDGLNIMHDRVIRIGNPPQELALITKFGRYDIFVSATTYRYLAVR